MRCVSEMIALRHLWAGSSLAVIADVCRVDAAVVLNHGALEVLPELLHGVAVVLLMNVGSGSSRSGNGCWGGGAGGVVGGGGNHFDCVEKTERCLYRFECK